MLNTKTSTRWLHVLAGLLTLMLAGPANARPLQQEATQPRRIDVVIALDVSGSMDGLIDSAKQRLWDIVNELGRAQPQPELRMALLRYGNPDYGSESGFVRVLYRPFSARSRGGELLQGHCARGTVDGYDPPELLIGRFRIDSAALPRAGESQVDAAVNRIGPARRDDLGTRVEVNALGAVDRALAKE